MSKLRGMLVTSLVVGGLALAVHAPPASACSCAVAEGPELLGFADVAFTGTLESMDGPADPLTSTEAVAYTFAVDAVYQGSTGPDVLVYSANNSASCGLEGMTVGARYVVFATTIATEEEASFLPGSQVGALTSGLCSGTAEVGAEGPPAFLGAGRPPAGAPAETPVEETPVEETPEASAGDDGDGGSGWILPVSLGAGAVVLVGVAVGAFAFTRRRATSGS
jgi:hypothetical protein